MDLVHGGALEPHGQHDMSLLQDESREWLQSTGFGIRDEALWQAALTHGSMGEKRDYQRLEFLGDRVLGLAIAEWLFAQSGAPEGKLSQRLNALVSREMCANVARRIGLPPHIRISKQAHEDGGRDSDNILGDVMEALLGAQLLEQGFEGTQNLVHELWRPALEGNTGQSKHPKSALQEWAAGNQRKPPEYALVDRSGPDHAARFTVRVEVHKVGSVEATASSKQEAEKQAAKAFMEKFA